LLKEEAFRDILVEEDLEFEDFDSEPESDFVSVWLELELELELELKSGDEG